MKRLLKINLIKLFAFSALFLCFQCVLKAQDYSKKVDPFIGTGANGHVYPGATVPFGMVQLSPDQQTTEWAFCSGYNYSSNRILGFSHTHLSGTGVGDLGDLLVMPYIGKKADTVSYPGATTFSHKQEQASPGYYSVFLPESKINVKLTTTAKVGFHEYTFPQSQQSFINFNLNHKVNTQWGKPIENEFVIENDSTFSGYKIVGDGWAPVRKLYFVIKLSKAPSQVFVYGEGTTQLNGLIRNGIKKIRNKNVQVNLRFDTYTNEKVLLKVALSTISTANARKNLQEVKGWNFNDVKNQAENLWSSYLSRIKVEASPDIEKIFYTSLYHTLIQPNQMADPDSSFTGPDYYTHKSKTGKFYTTFSLWDTYRATHPLYTILTPEIVPDMLNSMLQHDDINGYLPIWTLWGTENHCMIGNHSIPVLTDAILKGFKGIDIERAYQAIKRTLTTEHQNSHWNAWKYNEYGYMRADSCGESSVSRTQEFSYDDWCAAQIAKKLNYMDDYHFFMKRSQYYKNHFYPAKGMMWPRNTDGSWAIWDEYKVQFGAPYTEGNAWQYIWSVQHDPYGLISLFPDEKACISKLDSTFSNKQAIVGHLNDVTGVIGQYAHGNEPSHHTTYMYQFLGQPWKTQRLVRQIMNDFYTSKPDGLIGNEDCGQMSAWYVFSALGFYPFNPANGIYVLGSPVVNKATIDVANGKQFVIIAKNNNLKNRYVSAVTLNGKPYLKSYIRHADIEKGGILEFKMSSKPTQKEVKKENRPPLY